MKQQVDLGDRKVTVVGTAHVSEESRNEVKSTIEEVNPDLVGVELDEGRLETLQNDSGWRDLDLLEALRQGKGYLLFTNLLLTVYQRRIGMAEGVKPGAEMLEAINVAEEKDIKTSLVDREIGETLERLRSELGFIEKFKLISSFFVREEDQEYDLEDLKELTVLNHLITEMEADFPSIKKVLLDERNSYMAEKLLENDFENAVLVVGAAHMEGVIEQLKSNNSSHKQPVGTKIPWFKLVTYGFPIAVIAMFAYAFFQVGYSTGLQATTAWILINGTLAMLGAIIARSHVITWIGSFISAPLTSLYPGLGAGMVSAYIEGRLYPPKVSEMEDIVYITDYRDLWSNQVGIILLTFILVTMGSAIATFAGAGYMAGLLALI